MYKIQMTRGDRVLLGISADDIGLIDLCTRLDVACWLVLGSAKPHVPALTGLHSARNVIFTDNPHVAFKVLIGRRSRMSSHEEPVRGR